MRATLLLFFAALTIIPRYAWPQGNALGPEFRVNTYTTNHQAQPSVAVDSAGNFVVVWQRYYQYGIRNIFGQRFASSGGPLGAEFRVNTNTLSGLNNAPSVAADPVGNFVVIWEDIPLENAGLDGQRFASSGAPLGGQFMAGNAGYSLAPDTAYDSAGNFVVVWMTIAYPSDDVFGQRYSSSGAPVGPVFRINTYATGAQSYPSLASDSAGNFVVVWGSSAQDGSGRSIFGQRFASSGAPVGPEFHVNTYTTSNQDHPSVAADSFGNFVVVWESAQDGSGLGIFGQRYASSGAALGPEFLVNTFRTGDQSNPSMAADASGNFVVAWRGPGSGDDAVGVFAQRYASTGEALGSEFRVNTYTTNAQAEPAVAADPSGDFFVVWESDSQDGSGEGVFGQRWRPILPVELMDVRLE